MDYYKTIEGCYSAEAESGMMTGWLAGWEAKEKAECQSEKSEAEKSSGGASVENLKGELESLNVRLKAVQDIATKALDLHGTWKSLITISTPPPSLVVVPNAEKDNL